MPSEDLQHNVEFNSVYINCPDDDGYRALRDAIIFTITTLGFDVRSVSERSTKASRVGTFMSITSECGLAIYDLSRVDFGEKNRMRTLFELGVDIGYERTRGSRPRTKSYLFMDAKAERFRNFLSEIVGQEALAHNNDPNQAIKVVRDWLAAILSEMGDERPAPGATNIQDLYRRFRSEMPDVCKGRDLEVDPNKLTYADYGKIVTVWLVEDDRKGARSRP